MVLERMTQERFLKIYANLPVPERQQVIVVIDGKPHSWDRAFNEISGDTALGKKILEKMEALGIL